MRLTVSLDWKPRVTRLLNTLLVHFLAWRFRAFFSVFSVGLKLISTPNRRTHRLRNIAGLTPIRRTSGFPPVVRRPAIRPLPLPTMFTFWLAAADSLRVKGLYPVGCLPRVVSRIITGPTVRRGVRAFPRDPVRLLPAQLRRPMVRSGCPLDVDTRRRRMSQMRNNRPFLCWLAMAQFDLCLPTDRLCERSGSARRRSLA